MNAPDRPVVSAQRFLDLRPPSFPAAASRVVEPDAVRCPGAAWRPAWGAAERPRPLVILLP